MSKKKEEKKKLSIFTRETLGILAILFSTLCLICLITDDKLFSEPGHYVCAFLLGCFGYFSVLLACLGLFGGICLVIGKTPKLSKSCNFFLTMSVIIIMLLGQFISMHSVVQSGIGYGDYLALSYNLGEGGFATACGGGIIIGLIAYPFSALLTNIGTYVIFGVLLALCLFFVVRSIVKFRRKAKENAQFNGSYDQIVEEEPVQNQGVEKVEQLDEQPRPIVQNSQEVKHPTKKGLFVNNADDFALKTKREIRKQNPNAKYIFNTDNGINVADQSKPYSKTYSEDMQKKINYIKTPAPFKYDNPSPYFPKAEEGTKVSAPIREQNDLNNPFNTPIVNEEIVEDKAEKKFEIPFEEHDKTVANDTTESRAEHFSRDYAQIEDISEPITPPQRPIISTSEGAREIFSDIAKEQDQPKTLEQRLSEKKLGEREVNRLETNRFEDNSRIERDTFTARTTENQEQTPSVATRSESILSENNNLKREVEPTVSDRLGRDFGGLRKEETFEQQTQTADIRRNIDRPIISREERTVVSTNEERTIQPTREIEKPKDEPVRSNVVRALDRSIKPVQPIEQPVKEEIKKPAPPINRKYMRPPLDLLMRRERPKDVKEENHQEKMDKIKSTLEEFKIDVNPVTYVQGPTVTRYELEIARGISVKKVLNYDDDLQMRLETKNGVRIEAPIPGKDRVGVEVENATKVMVGIREVMEESLGEKNSYGKLMFAVGKDVVGNTFFDNLAKGPHYLVAGATGMGKSVCLNSMLVSLIMRYSPEELRLILIDPKTVEFRPYEHLPHLMIDEIICEPAKALAALSWAYNEMERRYAEFRASEEMVVDIEGYNNTRKPNQAKMPRIVIIMDEVADIMESGGKKEMESRIRALAQKSRSAGIHLVLATQRPSVDIITGTIKANLPSRIAFKVMNYNDSQTILGQQGAEKLLGNGDMLFMNSSRPECTRYQGSFISPSETNAVVQYIIKNNPAYFDDEMSKFLDDAVRPKQESMDFGGYDEDGAPSEAEDDLFIKALSLAISTGTISISQLQRRFSLGYPKAGKLIDKMETMGYISGNEGSKARKVLMTREEFENKYGSVSDL